MKNTLRCLSLLMLALASCSTPKSDSPKVVVKNGMTQDEISTALGKPSYKYAVNEQETWIYVEGNPTKSKLKSTALNMIPVAGPVVSYVGTRNPKTNAVKTAITFGKDSKVNKIVEASAAAPTAKP